MQNFKASICVGVIIRKKNDDVEGEEEAEQGSDTPRPNVSRILNHCVHYLLFTEQKKWIVVAVEHEIIIAFHCPARNA